MRHIVLLVSIVTLAVTVGCTSGRSPRAGASLVYVTEDATRTAFGGVMREMLARGDFDRLEAIADSLERTRARWPSALDAGAVQRGRTGDVRVALDDDRSTRGLPDSIADEFYARIVTEEGSTYRNVFEECPDLSWPRAKRGLLAWRARWPASTEPTSSLAMLGWMAGDRAVAQQAFASLGDTVDFEVWGSLPLYQAARQWLEKPPS